MPLVSVLKTFNKIVILLILQLFCIQQIIIAQEQDSIPAQVKKKIKIEPYRATMLAVVFPGMGQIYNRKYWKIPLVYAGFGAFIYAATYNASQFNDFTKAYQDFTDVIPETDSYLTMIPSDPSTYDPVLYPETYVPANASYWEDRMLNGVDYYKRYRDLSYIAIAGWYLISILDANVDASLFNFDISDNLDIAVVPVMISLPGGYAGAGLNMGMRINF